MTEFESAVEAVKTGKLTPPSVTYGNSPINYFGYQLSVHHYYLKIMAAGMMVRQMKLKDLKWYYGLKSKSAKDCLPEFVKVMEKYNESIGITAEIPK